MRSAFLQHLARAVAEHDHVHVLTADLGFKLFDPIAAAAPGRFLNVGLAEQTMVGMAAGMARNGACVFVYTMVPFIAMRCYEQIRLNLSFPRSNVNMIAVGGGFAYGENGHTHHGLEDIALMRTLPHVHILNPADAHEAGAALDYAIHTPGPTYIRLGRSGEPAIHSRPVAHTRLGQGIMLQDGHDLTVITNGSNTHNVTLACESLARTCSIRLWSLPLVSHYTASMLQACIKGTRGVVTVEEHFAAGGVGSAVCEALSTGPHPPIRIIAARHDYARTCMDRQTLLQVNQLDAPGIALQIETFWEQLHART